MTKEVSNRESPRIHHVIPYMDHLSDALDDYSSNVELFPAIRMAAKRGSLVLQKYYGKTDESIIFRIAMSMTYSMF